MIFRVYLRDAHQQVHHKTVTGSAEVALAAFCELVDRTDLDGQRLLTVLSRDGRPVAHHDFSHPPPDPRGDLMKWWRGRTDEIDLTRAG